MRNHQKRWLGLLLGLSLGLMSSIASAHPGHDTLTMMQGVLHPLTGLDHLLAMLAVGMWAAQLDDKFGDKYVYLLPACFVVTMLLGAGLGMGHAPLGWVEQGIAASVLVLGLLIAMRAQLPVSVSVMLIAGFAMLHGYAHGVEAQTPATTYFVGFVLSTVVLHLVGMLLSMSLLRAAQARLLRVSGVAIAVVGAVLCAA